MANTTYIVYNAAGGYLEVWVENVEVARIKSNGDVDLNSTKNPNAF